MYRYETLIFTGRGTGRMKRNDAKYIGDDPDYFYLGTLNGDRTVAETVIELCLAQSNCNAYEVFARIQLYTLKLIASGKFYKEFPDKEEDYAFMTLNDVERHLKSVVYRSKQGYSKFIPQGIERMPATEYFTYNGMEVLRASGV